MSDNSIGNGRSAVPPFLVDLAKNAPAMMWTFTATTFLSALLLFAIQPMFAKMVLPVLGGSPSVWSVSIFFFQAALLAGYLYAHILINKAPPHLTGLIHLGVCAIAFICLPIGMARWMGEPPQGEPYLWQLGMFAASIGLPFMAVSANAPLLQAWFARTGHPHARDPYFMYAASNLGSLVALLGYPFVLEPAFGLSQLSSLWAWGYGLLVLAIAASFFLMRGAQAGGVPETVAAPAGDATAAAEVPTLARRLGWIGLAFVPAALLTAFTAHITTDVASAPLLWVLPLALYLLTFVLVFRDRSVISREALLFLHLVALAIALFALSFQTHDWFILSATGVVVFFTTAMLAHRTLYEARPAPQHLTEFYLWMSLGGALGGMFTALVAPKLFSEIYEYPLLLAASMACRPGALRLSEDKETAKGELLVLWAMAAAGILVIWWLPILADWGWLPSTVAQIGWTQLVVVVLTVVLLANVLNAPRQLLAAALICLALVTLPSAVRQKESAWPGHSLEGRSKLTQRSFFGVYRVSDVPGLGYRTLIHGTTLHGAQHVYGDDGKPVDDTVPTTYYYPGSPIGQTIAKRRELLAAKGEKGTYGIVGLGTGSSSCHKQEGEVWKFFEIDPTVIKIAKDPKNFTFISKCQPDIDIAIGDARLTMAKEKNGSFDLFVIDAFTSDAIPVHMLTKQAVQLFLDKLKPDGVVLLHTSNRYLDLNSVLAAILKQLPAGTAGIAMQDSGGEGYGQTGSSVVVFAKSAEALEPYRSLDGVMELDDHGLRAWTDDYSDILGAFWSRYMGRG
ncbi:MAG TPA: fused MFS/spermidine synthase [Hyphomicrobiaceae bacterium]|nr:fused MFS/spermidine synthase [Hyphomicrobiaceae bacterium]